MDCDEVGANFVLLIEKLNGFDETKDFGEKFRILLKEDCTETCKLLSQIQSSIQELLSRSKQPFDSENTARENVPKVEKTEPIQAQNVVEVQKKPQFNVNLVQINADAAEVNRRINAFIERKQKEVDDINIREFCNVIRSQEFVSESSLGCARTDAVFVPRGDSKSHVKVSKVLNEYGPQTRLLEPTNASNSRHINIKQESFAETAQVSESSVSAGLGERLGNLEQHVGINTDSKDMFKRVKELEERVLYLESLSPEYFSSGRQMMKRRSFGSQQKMVKQSQMVDISSVEDKISALKSQLLAKKVKLEPT